MGSGETAGPLVAAHRLGIKAAGAKRGLILDTPYGFQENAPIISEKLAGFFRNSLSVEAEIVSYRSSEAGPVARERMLAALRRARYVFAGPGSPTYALEVWRDTPIAAVLRDILSDGGTVTFASAAALTAGARTLPVYEIYKVGAPLSWQDGLDLTSHLGLEAVFIPHWNNTEGRRFDTSRCYMGQHRFQILRSLLPRELGVIGMDEHTAAVIDFGKGTLDVMGVGGITVCGREDQTLRSGHSVDLRNVFELLQTSRPEPATTQPSPGPDLAAALSTRSAKEIAGVLLEVESQAAGGSQDARQKLQAMLLEVAGLAATGVVPPSELVSDYVDLLVKVRSALRADRLFKEADHIRSGLKSLGITLRDTLSGTSWTLETSAEEAIQ